MVFGESGDGAEAANDRYLERAVGSFLLVGK